ncbi:MAG: AAA family ATPase [Gammaproteobacteria bacterium]
MQTQELEKTQATPELEDGHVLVEIIPRRMMFGNEETSFYIYGVEPKEEDKEKLEVNNYGSISIKGFTPQLNLGEKYVVEISLDKKSNFKGSYDLHNIKQNKPQAGREQHDYLNTILTTNQVENIYNVYDYDQDIIGMIEDNTFKFDEVHGLGEKSYEKLREKVLSNLHMGEVLIFLAKYNIKYSSIKGLIKQYANPLIVIEKIKKNPYLLTEAKGVGFKKADNIAKSIGFDLESPLRINSAIRYIIKEENNSGHSWISRKRLLSKAVDLLTLKKNLIIEVLDGGYDKNIVEWKERFTTLEVYEAESVIAETIINMNKHSNLKIFESEEVLEQLLDEYCADNGVELEEKQREFFFKFHNNAVSLLIGGGGMGKTWILKILLDLIDRQQRNYSKALLAPTGKASKVLSMNTGRKAGTIHRKIIPINGISVIHDQIIVVDESSMCDVVLVSNLLKAISHEHIKLIFVGDDFQLPSVGVGNFLHDVIKSGRIPLNRLQKVFRTKDGGILEVSENIRENRKFLSDYDEGIVKIGKNAIFHLVDSEYNVDGVEHYYNRLLKKYKDEDILVLSPTKKNQYGVEALNKALQEISNPERTGLNEKEYGKDEKKVIFRVNDLVMNTDNMYQVKTVKGDFADVFNGDVGRILDIDEGRKLFIIDYGDDIVIEAGFDGISSSIVHANAMTVHKSQGSQSEVVILMLDKSMRYQLNANLLYTAVSRAKGFLIVIGDAKTINASMDKFANMERRSFLIELLEAYDTMQTDDLLDYRKLKQEYLREKYGNNRKAQEMDELKENDMRNPAIQTPIGDMSIIKGAGSLDDFWDEDDIPKPEEEFKEEAKEEEHIEPVEEKNKKPVKKSKKTEPKKFVEKPFVMNESMEYELVSPF